MKFRERILKNRYHFISLSVLAGSLFFSLFRYSFSFTRALQTFLDLLDSLKCYFFRVILRDLTVTAKVSELPNIDISAFLPFDWDELSYKLGNLFIGIFNLDNFLNYCKASFDFLYNFLLILTLILPVILMLWLMFRNWLYSNHGYGVSKPLKLVRTIYGGGSPKVRSFFRSYVRFLRSKRIYFILFCIIWLLNLNVISIAFSVLSFYFYFISCFNFASVFIFVIRLFVDVLIMFFGLPLPFWIVFGLFIYKKFVYSIGRKILQAHEAHNCAFISKLPICVMFTGLMGSGKTLMLTDIALSREVMFRNQALHDMYEITLRLPEFPFQNVEKVFYDKIYDHTVYNLSTCRNFVAGLVFDKQVYDYYNNSVSFYDEIKFESLWDLLSDYFQLFFIYLTESYIISNYSIRSDAQCISGYFPMYNSDFFDRDPERYYRSNFSHVLDYDILRMARPIVDENPNIGSLEFGILAATEYAKERLNTLERKKRRFDDTTTNPDNDGTNDRLKMIRNNATVRGYCYINFYFDDQRNQSLDADAREISNIVSIKERGDDRYAIPWLIGGIYFDFVSPFFEKLYFNIRHCRSDEFLFAYLLQKINAVLYRYFVRERNYYGYFKLRVNFEAGTLDEAASECKYYISRKKTYNRYISDVLRDYFRVQTADCPVGINDIPCYESVVASVDELKDQHSYFVDRMTKK